MGTGPQGRAFPRHRAGASGGVRIPGLQGSGDIPQLEAERPRNRREAKLKKIFARAAGALGRTAPDAIGCLRAPPMRQLWHRGSMRRDSARQEALIELCVARGCPRDDAEELVQEAHLRLFAYQRDAEVWDAESLLRHIVINLSINYYHRQLSKHFAFESIEKLDREEILIDPAPGPERIIAAEQQLERVVSLVSALSRRTCQIFIAQRGGYSYQEVAAAFVVKPRTIEKHVDLAISTLMEMMPGPFLKRAITGDEMG